MIKAIKAGERHFQDHGWLKTFWLFSFDSYFDPNNVQFGALRVFNDDKVEAGQGFDMHRHREMEIVTIVLKGAISHEDSLGNRKRVKAGEVQIMSAGTGIKHSEYNLENKELHLYQIWFLPNQSELTPSYDQKDFSKVEKSNRLVPVVSGDVKGDALFINSNATLYLGNLERGKTVFHTSENGKKQFVYVTDGQLSINGQTFLAGDQARIENESELKLAGVETTNFILIDLY